MITLQPNGNLISKLGMQHDLQRVKWDETDFFVIGEIDAQAMCQFQCRRRSPAKPFKPKLDRFKFFFAARYCLRGKAIE